MLAPLISVVLADPEVSLDVVRAGDGKSFPKKGQTVTVHYVGTLLNGNKFDSSRDRGQPFQFTLGVGHVIRGWDIAVARMSRGEIARATIPYQLAYGERGVPPTIPAKSDLVFEIELLDFK